MHIRLSFIIESTYGCDQARSARIDITTPDGVLISSTTIISDMDDVTTYVLDTIVPAPPTPAGPESTPAEERALEEWARAILLCFIVTGRSGGHIMTITASSQPAIMGDVFDFHIDADRTGPVPADRTA